MAADHEVHVVTSTRQARTLVDAGVPTGDHRPGATVWEGATVHRVKAQLAQGQRLVSTHVNEVLRSVDPELIVAIAPAQLFTLQAFGFASRASRPLVCITGENSEQGAQSGLRRLATLGYRRTLWRQIMRRTVGRADRVLVSTPETRQLLEGIATRSPVTLVPLPYRSDRFRFDPGLRAQVRENLGLGQGSVTLFIGRCQPGKRIEDLVSSWESGAGQDSESRLVIAGLGTDSYSDWIRTTASRSPAADRISLHPFVEPDQVSGFLNAADITVWPTVSVGIQQAMGTGVRVLVPESSAGAFLARQYPELAETYDQSVEGLSSALVRDVPTASRGERSQRALATLSDVAYARIAIY
jgi:glycosyltransferase involved in cell wall biosynthesis